MGNKDLRPIEYQSAKESKDFFTVEYETKSGFFHTWENFTDSVTHAIIEDSETGNVIKLRPEKIRFLTEAEISKKGALDYVS